jgi:hypothetical protein
MTTTDQVGWSRYRSFEGPFFPGHKAAVFKLPPDPSEAFKLIAVTTAAEGGNLSAINGYDRMIISVGALQWGEAGNYAVSDLLGAIISAKPSLIDTLRPALERSAASFKRRADGRWRFSFNDARGEVNSISEQQQLFLLHSRGEIGTWDDASREHAKTWVANVADVLKDPDAQRVQIEWSLPRVQWFLLKAARDVLYAPGDPASDGIVGATRAIVLSYAVNLPVVASNLTARYQGTGAKWSEGWCLNLLRSIVFDSKVTIWPNRWNDIRPIVERIYGVNLPDFAIDLAKWQTDHGITGSLDEPSFLSTKEIQEELLAEGYDLGPAGSDGSYGSATRSAVMDFQRANRLQADGAVGPLTRQALLKQWRSRNH